MDYYKILELDALTATNEDISASFRKLSVKNHPMMNQDKLAAANKEFSKICEAYEVLSNK